MNVSQIKIKFLQDKKSKNQLTKSIKKIVPEPEQ